MSRFYGAAASLAQKLIGGNVVPYNLNPTLAGGVEQILSPDPERAQLTIYNLSASDVFVGFDADVSSTNGFYLGPNGGFMSMNLLDDLDAITQPIWIYTSVAGGKVFVYYSRRLFEAGEQ